MKKILFRSLLILIGILILLLILAPGIAKRYTISHSKELIGRQIEMDKLKVNYFTGMIRVTDFTMFEADNTSPFITFDTLIVNLVPFQFFIDKFVLDEFYLRGLHVNLVQTDSSFNFDDLVEFHSSQEDTIASSDTTGAEPTRFHLSNIALKHATIEFDDRNINKVTALRDVSFFVPYIGWDQEEKSEAGLRFAFKNEGYFESTIDIDPVVGDFEADVTIYHLYLETFQEYASEYFNINSLGGKLSSEIIIKGNINEAEKAKVYGDAEIIGFEMTDRDNKKFLGAERINCRIQEINNFDMSYVIDSLILTGPYVYFELDTATNNLFEIFNISPETADTASNVAGNYADSSHTAQPLHYAINALKIENGIIDYTDNLTGEPFDYYLDEIMLETDSIESTAEWIDLYASMKLNQRGTLNAEVGLNPADPMNIHLQYVIADFQLGDLNIYSRFYMGFPIVYGDMYYKSDTRISGGQLSSENKLVMQNVELGEKSGGLYDLPLKFALFLLKDRDDVISLDIPVSGDLNDPRVNVGKIVWNTFKNLIVKVAASPFDFLAGLISVDPSDIKEIEYAYGDTTLTESKMKQLGLLLELEEKKKGLQIELVYFNDNTLEKEALAIEEIGQEYNGRTSGNYKEEKEQFERYVMDRLEVDTLKIGAACLQLVDQPSLDSLVAMFNAARKNQVERHFKASSDSTHITTRFSNPKAPKNVGSIPVFEIKYFIDSETADQDQDPD